MQFLRHPGTWVHLMTKRHAYRKTGPIMIPEDRRHYGRRSDDPAPTEGSVIGRIVDFLRGSTVIWGAIVMAVSFIAGLSSRVATVEHKVSEIQVHGSAPLQEAMADDRKTDVVLARFGERQDRMALDLAELKADMKALREMAEQRNRRTR